MDKIDLEILQILQKKARIPNVEVARTIGMAPSAVLERIKKLEARGVIDGYEVRLNPEMFNCSMIAFVQIKTAAPNQLDEVAKQLSHMEQVQEVHLMAGEDCLMAKLRVGSNAELAALLQTKIAAIKSITQTKTHIAISTFKESAKIMLPDTLK